MKFLLPFTVILVVTGGTFLVVWFRYVQLAASNGPSSSPEMPRQLIAFAFTTAAFLFGAAVLGGFYGISGIWQNADRILMWTSLVLTVLFTTAAIVVRTQVVKSGALESVILNLLWGAGYGVLLPIVMKYVGLVRVPA